MCRIRSEIQRLEMLQQDASQIQTTPEQIAKVLDEAAAQLFESGPEAMSLLRRLAPKIWAAPYQQFNSDKVVLRAKFDLQLCQLLPQQLQTLLAGQPAQAVMHR